MATVSQIRERLEHVMDPCSVAMQVPSTIGEMGLVRRVDVEDGNVSVVLGVTTPLCHMIPFFFQQVDEVLKDLPGVTAVHCEIDQSPGWTPRDMSPEARRRIEKRYARRKP